MMAIATTVNTSGIPTASNPEIIVFHSVASEVLVTTGMSNGLSHPTISMVSPKRKRHPARGDSVCVAVAFTMVESFARAQYPDIVDWLIS
jgi:hypothetical protein